MAILNMAQTEKEAREHAAPGTEVHPYHQDHRDGAEPTCWVYKTHVGVCLQDREQNGYDDSDFWMEIWDEEKQETREICFASTRGWSYPCYGSAPDATPEVAAKANAYRRRLAVAAAIGSDKAKARRAAAGKVVDVVKGRKAPLGRYLVHHVTEGWSSRFTYNNPYAVGFGIAPPKPLRLAMHPLNEDGTVNRAAALVWTADSNVQVVNPEQYETAPAEIEARFAREEWYFPREQKAKAS